MSRMDDQRRLQDEHDAQERIKQTIPPVGCLKVGQWHQFTTVATKHYTVPSIDADCEPLSREEVRAVCVKCGAAVDPFDRERR